MLDWHRSNSAEFPRQKIYMTSLSQLMERKLIIQPEVEVTNKLFPQRNFAKKLANYHQRIKSNIQLRSRKFDLHLNSKKVKNLVVESSRSPTSQSIKREVRHKSQDFRSTQLSTATHFRNEPQTLQPIYSSTLPESFTSRPLMFDEQL